MKVTDGMGTVPREESVQKGYESRQAKAYCAQMHRHFKALYRWPVPKGLTIRLESAEDMCRVVLEYDDDDVTALMAARRLKFNPPKKWDETAREEL